MKHRVIIILDTKETRKTLRLRESKHFIKYRVIKSFEKVFFISQLSIKTK